MDDREKLIKDAISHFNYGVTHDIFSEPVTTYAKLAGAALEYIRYVPDMDFGKWIPVTERLPERTLPPKDVLVYHDLGCGMFVDRAWYSYDKKRWCSVLGMKLKVTHWMPLPEPPKEEQK